MSKYIKQVQTDLKDAGLYHGVIDGIAGNMTVQAVQAAIASGPIKVLPTSGPVKLLVTDKYKLSNISKDRLSKVHSDLQKVVERAIRITDIDFSVGEGLRTLSRQKELVRRGASQTMNSRHLTGHAVDLIALDDDGKVSWDWPLYYKIEKVMKQAADDVGVSIEWGGDWRSFKDGPHWQLPWSKYAK